MIEVLGTRVKFLFHVLHGIFFLSEGIPEYKEYGT